MSVCAHSEKAGLASKPEKRVQRTADRRNFLVVQWLRLHTFNAGVSGLNPGGETNITHAAWYSRNIF